MIIGLTGQTGAGKSTAALILKNMGFYIIDADKVGHEITDLPLVLKEIEEAFGKEFVLDGSLNRPLLGKAVFADKAKLKLLNSITHPKITEEIIHEALNHSEGAVIDCALLRECGLDKICNIVINITAPQRTRMERIMLRDGLSREDAMNRIKSQQPYSGSCISIENIGSEEDLSKNIREALCKENQILP